MRINPEDFRVTPDSTIEDIDLDEKPWTTLSGQILDEAAAERLAAELLAKRRAID
ncbi:hypothetical protein [Herbiconiux sp. L3-i23]|uniref:hypothetical protein n=1 Tax=Herbiconiux sp. L3-i23 TaxID=2905871 RepID=UPI0020531675|nr:hypothetical protein [Herbiconiux sp. L3-i23]BDI22540.1 hypothetical protein L3i23_13160 [Herbiconiux sp. L3-i23]